MDKDIALLLAEMLIKQDENTDQIKLLTDHARYTNDQLKVLTVHAIETSNQISVLTDHAQEMTSNIRETNNQIRETNNILREFMGVSVKQWEQQHAFNEIFSTELRSIKDLLSTLTQIEARLKAIEERESKFESRLAHIEKMLKAS